MIDPDNVTPRSKVSKTIKSDLFEKLNLNALAKYEDLLSDYFTENSLNTLKEQFKSPKTNNNQSNTNMKEDSNTSNIRQNQKTKIKSKQDNENTPSNTEPKLTTQPSTNQLIYGNSTSHGEKNKAYEINETGSSVVKQINGNLNYFLVVIAVTLILLAIGYKRNRKLE